MVWVKLSSVVVMLLSVGMSGSDEANVEELGARVRWGRLMEAGGVMFALRLPRMWLSWTLW